MFTEAILQMLFSETGNDYQTFISTYGIVPGETSDQVIYQALLNYPDIIELIGDIGMHVSWMDNFIGPT